MERTYGWIYHICAGNELLINAVAGVTILNVCFYLINSIFIFFDAFDFQWARKYKIQEEKKTSFSKYVESLKLILFNQFVTAPITCALLHYPGTLTGVSYGKTLPGWPTVLVQIVWCILVEEVGFYYSHRLFHHPKLYKHIHKIHHEWTAPISITSIYCHPIEHAFSNLAPVLIGPILCGAHITTFWIWACVAMISTTCSHSGYHFPLQSSPEAHDYHHRVFNECFGVLGYLDHLHGTAERFRKSVYYKRHITYFSLKTIKELYPDGQDELKNVKQK
ncbi:unnamed protein product [Nippostrongylus brasiliensis]|uniref:Fatty acid hydroxylase domain-containing protein n=1 Tax=Nippostrongylus brasiliensis TaxID=27835 RepID=A0A0N4YFC1_NIPBR|nr:hypothetical protein Q1695_006171 [Nippostrongylus brasiliensis]VDL79042.1 unnamed protein product [Nippostrongylus brasiliensis]